MSTKSHFIYGDGIEGYEETSEPKSIFGKFVGNTVYLFIENHVLQSFKMIGEYVIIETKPNTILPNKFKIWGDAILEFYWDDDGLCIKLEGGHYVTKKIINKDFPEN